jgi:protein involved in polysaccharide export with SLBB domain
VKSRVLLVCVALAACGPTSRTVVEQPATIPSIDTSLGVGDSFEVRVFGEPDLSGLYKVGSEGTINFPLVGVLRVEGLDAQAVSKLLSEKLSEGMLRNPQVTVLIKDQTSKKVFVIGQVGHPGTFNYTPSMNIVEAITVAGGFTGMAAKNDTTVSRLERGKKTTLKVPVADIGEGKAPNVYLRPGDIISVPERIF